MFLALLLLLHANDSDCCQWLVIVSCLFLLTHLPCVASLEGLALSLSLTLSLSLPYDIATIRLLLGPAFNAAVVTTPIASHNHQTKQSISLSQEEEEEEEGQADPCAKA
jgi:hypothetical protein